MNEELVTVEGLVLEKMLVRDLSDDDMMLKNTQYDVNDSVDRGDKYRDDNLGGGAKRFNYQELMIQKGAGEW